MLEWYVPHHIHRVGLRGVVGAGVPHRQPLEVDLALSVVEQLLGLSGWMLTG